MATYALILFLATGQIQTHDYGPLEYCNLLAYAITQTATDVVAAQCVEERGA
jgi:hypothetical protein